MTTGHQVKRSGTQSRYCTKTKRHTAIHRELCCSPHTQREFFISVALLKFRNRTLHFNRAEEKGPAQPARTIRLRRHRRDNPGSGPVTAHQLSSARPRGYLVAPLAPASARRSRSNERPRAEDGAGRAAGLRRARSTEELGFCSGYAPTNKKKT